jgi:hypothetical protein
MAAVTLSWRHATLCCQPITLSCQPLVLVVVADSSQVCSYGSYVSGLWPFMATVV